MKNAKAKELPQEIDRILGIFESKIVSDVSDALRGRGGARTFGVDDNPKAQAKLSLQALIDKRVALEVTKIRSLFNMSEFNHIGTMKDKHMLTRAPEEVEESKRYNRDHSWANMYAQGKIDKYIKGIGLLVSNPDTTTKANSDVPKSKSIRRDKR